MIRGPKSLIKVVLVSLFAVVIISYTIFQSWKIIQGPVINIYEPENGRTFTESLVEIEGTTKNISHLYLNDRPIFTDVNGYFKEKFLLSPGYNVIKINGYDKFKKGTEKIIEVVLKEY